MRGKLLRHFPTLCGIVLSVLIALDLALLTQQVWVAIGLGAAFCTAALLPRPSARYAAATLACGIYLMLRPDSYPLLETKWIAFALPVVTALVVRETWSPILGGVIGSLSTLIYISAPGADVNEIIGKAIGILLSTLCYTILSYVITTLVHERNGYRSLSERDPLTGLYNLRHVMAVGQKWPRNTPMGILSIDIDEFKQINDTFGHVVGNKVLQSFAQALQACVEELIPGAVAGRIGGDEFLICLSLPAGTELAKVRSRMIALLEEHTYRPDPELAAVRLSFSVGSSQSSPALESIDTLIRMADIDLYERKLSTTVGSDTIHEIDDILSGAAKSALETLRERDVYTFVHSRFVRIYAVALGEYLQLSQSSLNALLTAGWVHDMGKLLIPGRILRKPSALTTDEYDQMRAHVNYGVSLIAETSTRLVIDAVKYHHEWWDGSGYPHGMRGADTPIEARIMQIADAFSAMTVKRVYRTRLSADEALAELERYKGTQFDPGLTDAFVAMVKNRYGETNKECDAEVAS